MVSATSRRLMLSLVGAAAAVTLALLAGCETTGVQTSGGVAVKTSAGTVSVVFTDQDKQLIRDYYAAKPAAKKVPPGLAKRDELPPGLQKRIAKQGALPPGLEGRALPADLEPKLSRLPEDYARVIIDADIAILNTKTRVVVDILADILTP